jgi:hypothetical protein
LEQVQHDPTLSVTKVAEALGVEVVRQACSANRVQSTAKVVDLLFAQVADHDLEVVAIGRLGGDGLLSVADVLDPELLPQGSCRHGDAGSPRNAHELGGDALAVLQTGHADVAGGYARARSKLSRRFERRQLFLDDTVDAVSTGLADDAFAKAFADLEVRRSYFEFHV